MSDDVNAAIADALRGHVCNHDSLIISCPEHEAEAAFDAAVEAGMAPPAEVERLRAEIGRLVDAYRRLRDDAIRVGGQSLAYREALERLANNDYRTCPCGRTARAALDGDDQHEPLTCGQPGIRCRITDVYQERIGPGPRPLDGDR